MSNVILKTAIRTKFALTARNRATRQIERIHHGYRRLAELVDEESGSRAVRVPKMAGVDDDMRNWSFYMILEHNVIVNRSISSIINSLMRGEAPRGRGAIDMKRDVMPSEDPGPEQVDALADSLADHLQLIAGRRYLRRSATVPHPLFGEFNAHQWHCMLGFHLLIHYRQAKYVAEHAGS